MKTFTTVSGRTIKVAPDATDRTFTIITECAVYKTTPMDEEEFNSCLNHTGNDWQYFLRNCDDYYVISKDVEAFIDAI